MEEHQVSQSLQYCKSMAGMFQSVLTGCRVLQPGIEEFLEKTKKLETQLQSTITTFTSFNESLKGLAEKTNIGRTGRDCDEYTADTVLTVQFQALAVTSRNGY